MIVAAIEMKALKLWSVLHERMAPSVFLQFAEVVFDQVPPFVGRRP